MAEESNLLTARIELSLRAVEQGAKAIQGAVDSINEKTDFNALKNQFATLASGVTAAADKIGTEIKKINESIDLSQVALNLQNLDKNVATIMNDIQSHLTKMTETVKATAQEANKSDFDEVKNQLTALQESVQNFITLTNSKDFLSGFSGKKTAGAVKTMSAYADAMKKLANIDLTGLTNNLTKLSAQLKDENGNLLKDEKGNTIASLAGVDISNLLKQVSELGQRFGTLRKQVNGTAKAIEALTMTDMTKVKGVVEDLAASLDKAKFSLVGSDLQDINKYTMHLRTIVGIIGGFSLSEKGNIKRTDTFTTLNDLKTALEGIKTSLDSIVEKVGELPSAFKSSVSKSVKEVSAVDDAAGKTTSKLKAATEAIDKFRQAIPNATQVSNLTKLAGALEKIKSTADYIKESFDKMNASMSNATKNTSAMSQKMTADVHMNQLLKGLSSVGDESNQVTITLGRDIANIAAAMKHLSEGDGLKNLVQSLGSIKSSGATDEIKQITEAFTKLEKSINNVGQALTKTLNGKALSTMSAKGGDKYKSIQENIDGAAESMRRFMSVDTGKKTTDIANFAQTMEKLSDMITRIFTTYSSSGELFKNIGAEDFASHLRTITAETKTSDTDFSRLGGTIYDLQTVIREFSRTCDEASASLGKVDKGGSSKAVKEMTAAFNGLKATIDEVIKAQANMQQSAQGATQTAQTTQNISQSATTAEQAIKALSSALNIMNQTLLAMPTEASTNGGFMNIAALSDNLAQIVPNAKQLEEVLRGLSSISGSLVEGLFHVDVDGNPIQPFFVSLQETLSGFRTACDGAVASIGQLSNIMASMPAEASVTGGFQDVRSVLESIQQLVPDAMQLQEVLRGISTMSGQLAEGLFQLDDNGNPIRPFLDGTIRLDAGQFEQLTKAIQESTKAITDFVNSIAKMKPAELDSLLSNIITLANATGNATAESAAKMKQTYADMQGHISDMQHAIKEMMKADPATFNTYQEQFNKAAEALKNFKNALNQGDGGYHEIETEKEIVRQLESGLVDAKAAMDKLTAAQNQAGTKTENASILGKVEQLKELSSAMGKLNLTTNPEYAKLDAQITSLIASIKEWHETAAKTPEVASVWGKFEAVLVKVQAAQNAVLEKQQKFDDAMSRVGSLNSRIKELQEQANVYGSVDDAMSSVLEKYGAMNAEVKVTDTVGTNLEDGLEEPLKRVISFYQEGAGTITATIRSIKDEEGNLFYYVDDMGTRSSNYDANGSVQDIVALYQKLFEAKARLAQLKDTDTNSSAMWRQQISNLQQALAEYEKLSPELVELARATENYKNAQAKLNEVDNAQRDKSNAAKKKEQQTEYNNRLKDQYRLQSQIQKLEIQNENESNQATRAARQNEINGLKTQEAEITSKIQALEAQGINNPERKAQYQRQLNNEKAHETTATAKTLTLEDKIWQRLKMIVLYRGLRKMWTEATDAAQEYYDLLNEIQIVMQNSDGEIEAMSQQFQQMAKDLQISVTDIATSAVEFVRQGLSESETMERTEWASMYAKVTAQEFDEASEQITATVNSMGVSAQEAVDLFVYLGDNSATSGAEVAEAFQKASAAAASFGLDMNHLGAWIATVSAKTRTDASSIGTSFNSILARWHSIKSTGYSEDDDGDVVGVNDITKALSSDKVNISLFDEMGEWRDMADVLDELAGKWNTLDSITQSYIATTMAGTRQQNVFLALMEDMAKGAEGGSIAYKLYEGSLTSAGTVSQKYQTYLESVTAAQDKMTVSLENLYSTFMNGNVMKDFYNMVSALIDNVTSGLPYINTKLLAIIAAGGALAVVIAKVVKAIQEVYGAVKGLSGLKMIGGILTSGKLGIILAGAGLLVTAITAVIGAFKNASDEAKNVDFSGQISSLQNVVTNVEPLIQEYETLASKTIRTQEETERMNELFLEIGTTSDIFAAAMNKVSSDTATAEQKINAMNEALAETKQLLAIVEGSEKAYAMKHAADNYSGLTASQDAYEETLGFGAEPFTEELYGSAEEAVKAWWDSIVRKHVATQDAFGNSSAKSYVQDVMGIDLGYFSTEGFKGRYSTFKSASELNEKEIQRLISIWENYQSSVETLSSMTAMEQDIEDTLSDDIQAVLDGLVETAKKEDPEGTIAKMTEAQIEGARDAMIDTIQKRSLTEDVSTVISEEAAKAETYLTDAAANTNYDNEYMEKYLTSWLGSEEDWSQTAQELVQKGITTSMIDLARTNWKNIGVDWAGETLAQNMLGNVKMSDVESRMLAGGYLKNMGWSGNGSKTKRFASTSYNIGSKANWGNAINFDYGQDAVIEVTPVMAGSNTALTPEELNNYIGDVIQKARENQTSILEEDEKGLILSILPVTNGDFSGTLETNGVGEKIAEAAAEYTQIGGGLEDFINQGQSVGAMLDSVASDFMEATGYAENYEERVNSLKDSMIGFGISTENIIALFQKMTTLMDSGKLSWDEIWAQYTAASESEGGFSSFVKWMQDTIQTLTGEDMAETAMGWSDILNEFVNNEDLGDEDSISLIKELIDDLYGVEDVANASSESLLNFSAAYNELTKTNRKTIRGMLDISDELWDKLTKGSKLSVEEAAELADALEQLWKELELSEAEDAGKVLEGVADAFAAAKKDAKTFNEEMSDVVSSVETARNAQLAYQYVLTNDSGAEYYEDAMSDLESYTGLSANAIANNMGYVSQIVAADMGQAESSIYGLCNAIGVLSSSNISINDAGLLTLQGTTDETTGHVVTLINTLLDAAGYKLMTVLNKDAGTAELKVVSNGSGATYTPKSSSSSGGGGGGGGGGDSDSGNNGNSEEERWVTEIENRLQRISDRMSQLSTIMDSWDSEGYYTAEIKALKQTNDMLEEQDEILEEKIAEAKERLKPLIEEFNATEPDTEAYDEILERVNTIQDAITDWTQELTENESSLVSNRQKVDELNDSIRELHLDLEEEILSAIEDREDRIDEMLQARIEMEETILEILKAQAEDAEQAILDALDAQIDALEKEKDAVSELLDARKEQAEEEDNLTELQELQTKYARIIADPTRAKDAADILEEIRDLEDEIAWNQAENENEAQQDSLDQQIDSLEDYRDYIEQYYEDLLDNPRNFIDQVDAILKMSQEDILTWLMQNSDDYKNATDATREDTVNGWTETLNEMNGVVETHWAEVQALINEGQDAVIAFLEENSADYREASKLQQEAYVDGWVDMFDSITKAYQDMEATLLDNSAFINDSEWGGSGDSSSSGGGGGGGGSSGSSGDSGKKWAWSLDGVQAGMKTYDTKEEAQKALDESVALAKKQMDAALMKAKMTSSSRTGRSSAADLTEYNRLRNAYNTQKRATVAQFAKGGIADYTGLVQVDGTKVSPERILSGTQTKLFDTLVKSLEQMSRVSVSPMRYNGEISTGKAAAGYTFGDINISVDRLDSDRDIEDLADKVKDAIVESMTKGRAVGGITL